MENVGQDFDWRSLHRLAIAELSDQQEFVEDAEADGYEDADFLPIKPALYDDDDALECWEDDVADNFYLKYDSKVIKKAKQIRSSKSDNEKYKLRESSLAKLGLVLSKATSKRRFWKSPTASYLADGSIPKSGWAPVPAGLKIRVVDNLTIPGWLPYPSEPKVRVVDYFSMPGWLAYPVETVGLFGDYFCKFRDTRDAFGEPGLPIGVFKGHYFTTNDFIRNLEYLKMLYNQVAMKGTHTYLALGTILPEDNSACVQDKEEFFVLDEYNRCFPDIVDKEERLFLCIYTKEYKMLKEHKMLLKAEYQVRTLLRDKKYHYL